MRFRYQIILVLAFLGLACPSAWSDQITLKDGREFSGKFVRGDANTIEFQILGRVETFKVSDVDRITFKQPEMVNPAPARSMSTVPPSGGVTPSVAPPAARDLSSQPQMQSAASQYGTGVTFPAGTEVTIRMGETVDTDRNRVGDTFNATLDEPLTQGDQVIVPRGAKVKGRVAYAKESGRVSGQSELILELTELTVNGRTYPLSTSDYSEVGASRGRRTAATAGGVAALGAIVGAIAGGGKGAAIGAATGAAAGAGVTVLTHGQTLHVPVETLLDFKLQKPLTIDSQ